MSRGRLFVVTGPSGVGKGTLIRELLERVRGLELSVSATTRPPRPGERDGVDYHFIDEEEFGRRLDRGEFLEHATYSGHRYGTLKPEVESGLERGVGVVLEIELQGARQIRRRVPDAVRVFVAPPTPEALRERLEGRGTDTDDQINRRLEVARRAGIVGSSVVETSQPVVEDLLQVLLHLLVGVFDVVPQVFGPLCEAAVAQVSLHRLLDQVEIVLLERLDFERLFAQGERRRGERLFGR
ncbi:hypothetical protein LCGC14_3125740, partial [marine sediment metagenome]